MIASTFWKNTMPLCTGCDQSTAVSSLWWSAKLPAVWKNFFGRIGASSFTSAYARRSPVSRDLAAALEVLAGRGHVEFDDGALLEFQTADAAAVEGDELHGSVSP